jgi:predicted AAA+ superfamily ATPase
LLSDESVIEREFGNLEKIDDNYEKIVVTLDDVNPGNRNGIKLMNAGELIASWKY